jgi:septal ring factor EnvC (AmiA/AmiB activator)
MGKSKAVKQDNIEQLQNELECLKYELDSNESEQIELRSMARYLHKEIEKIERQLTEMDVEYD